MPSPDHSRLFRVLMASQSLYFLATGLWPLIHLKSFLVVTGPKDDIWLVETVGVLVTAIGACLAIAALRGSATPEVLVLAIGSAAGLALIDLIYTTRGRIAKTYLIDVAIEAALLVAWGIYLFARRASDRERSSDH
jgi:ABC-type cobalamin transport system permease subunit